MAAPRTSNSSGQLTRISRVALGHVCYRYTWKHWDYFFTILGWIMQPRKVLRGCPVVLSPRQTCLLTRPPPGMWLLLPYSGSASLEARPTTLNSIKDAGTSSRWVHAVQTTDSSNSLEVFVPPGRRIVTPAGARTIHSAPSQ